MRVGNRERSVWFRRFLLSQIAVIVISLAIVSAGYLSALKTIENNSIQTQQASLSHVARIIDNYFSYVEQVATEICANPTLQSFLFKARLQAGSTDVWNLLVAHRNLKEYSITSDFKEIFYIYYARSELVLSRTAIHYGFDYHYANIFNFNDMSGSQYRELLFNQYYEDTFLPATKVSIAESAAVTMLPYIKSFPRAGDISLGVVVVLVDEEEIRYLLNYAITANRSCAYILNEENNVLSSVINSEKSIDPYLDFPELEKRSDAHIISVEGEPLMVASVKSELNNWRYVSAIPVGILMTKAKHARNIMIIVLLLTFAVGLILTEYLTYRNTAPIRDVIALLRKTPLNTGKPDFSYLRKSVSELIDSNENLKQKVARQSVAVRASFVNHLLRGEIAGDKEANEMVFATGLTLAGESFLVLSLRIVGIRGGDAKENHSIKTVTNLVLEDVVQNAIQHQGYVITASPSDMVVIICFGNKDAKSNRLHTETLIDDILKFSKPDYRIRIAVGVGNFCDHLIDVGRSYIESKMALRHCVENGETRKWYFDLRSNTKYFSYPIEIETKLANCAKAGNSDEVSRILGQLYEDNFSSEGCISANMCKCFLNALLSTVYRIAEELGDVDAVIETNTLSNLISTDNFGDAFTYIKDVYLSICNTADNRKRSHNEKLIGEIISFIDTVYARKDLNAYIVARGFHLSESYFCQFFKEHRGITFSKYLEQKRIESACVLLSTDKDRTIEEIAEAVGYYGGHSFRRAFKRLNGVTPREFTASVSGF